jgi:PBP1b-binding outer membrane lipoprotein LpoB
MKSRSSLFILLVVLALLLAACRSAAPAEELPAKEPEYLAEPVAPSLSDASKAGEGVTEQSVDAIGFPVADTMKSQTNRGT